MTQLSRQELTTLVEKRPGWHVSMFLPMQRAGVETLQNAVRCKNVLRQAEEQLLAGGLRAPEAQDLLVPVQELLADYAFWQHQSAGLALFVAPEVFRMYRLPLAFEELVVVNQRFHIKPLLPLFSEDGQFYVLALSQNQVRLLACTRYSVDAVEIPNAPQSLAEALQYDDAEKQLQFHTETQPSTGGRGAIFFGTGSAAADDDKDRIAEYFRQVDRGVNEVLRQTSAPLVLAGVEYLLPLYHEVTSYTHVLSDGLTGNPEGLRPEELQERARSLVEPLWRRNLDAAVARYRRYAGTGLASHDLKDVLLAAYYGRVETLFVARNVQQWGTFDAANQNVQVESEAAPEREDLLDCAALHTFRNSGTVYALPLDQVPDAAPVAAVLRY